MIVKSSVLIKMNEKKRTTKKKRVRLENVNVKLINNFGKQRIKMIIKRGCICFDSPIFYFHISIFFYTFAFIFVFFLLQTLFHFQLTSWQLRSGNANGRLLLNFLNWSKMRNMYLIFCEVFSSFHFSFKHSINYSSSSYIFYSLKKCTICFFISSFSSTWIFDLPLVLSSFQPLFLHPLPIRPLSHFLHVFFLFFIQNFHLSKEVQLQSKVVHYYFPELQFEISSL